MKIYEAYELAIRTGMSADPRPDSEVRKVLDDARETYEKLPEDRKELFDPERLWNPYSDCRFSVMADEAREMEAERMMWGIDIGSAEVLLADRLRERGVAKEALDVFVKKYGESPEYFEALKKNYGALLLKKGEDGAIRSLMNKGYTLSEIRRAQGKN